MYILGIDTSSMVATAAVMSPDKLLCEYVVNNKKNHSEKMMQVVDRVLQDSGIAPEELDAVAVAIGPGSFTGIRIGMACAEGMAHALGKPMLGINTLDGLAYNLMWECGIICPVMDAQRGEVYTCLYRWEDGRLNKLAPYEVVKARDLLERLSSAKERTIVLGDGVPVLGRALDDERGQKIWGEQSLIKAAPPALAMPRASSIAAAALDEYAGGRFDTCYTIKPFYIRRSHAEEKWEEQHGRARTGRCNN
ncbi:MAG: tRNA (adenosine(37)-N6)-threonylcarbamoyltransferase complex dimerization subunit type 1 TsaB [Tepidanaerobacteraceae bacterium]|jgi:tRNA threonylcarbamoyladenosine biosynthesis protein TsaB|nr:tRNA (adenosine(37)-N6)-threonylcarbamoyltransferase complex dimerization subunit type 1 TsaB [Tepidanaerobacteraceae bacterium]